MNLDKKLIDAEGIVEEIFTDTMHQKRQRSLAHAAMGVLASESLFLHEMGAGLARIRLLNKKHATKQIDRLLSNKKLSIWDISEQWVPYVIGNQKQLLVAMDWTSFADDKQWMLSVNIVTGKGIATPLLWKTVDNSSLKHNRARYEDQILSRLKEVLPAGVKVTLLADRGFADQKFFKFISEELQFFYIIRIKNNTLVSDENQDKKASEWVVSHKAVCIKNAKITVSGFPVSQVVMVKDKGMKAAWILASNTDLKVREVTNCYAKRWKIEPFFRDLKSGRFGYGLRETHFKTSSRRDRLMLIVALSYLLLVMLGQAGESLGFDKKLKVNTVKTRTHSLFRQGQFYYEFFQNFTPQEQSALLEEFGKLLNERGFWCDFFSSLK
jgi:hypothetical protein